MTDVLLVLIAIGFFALCVLYVRGCARMIDRAGAEDVDEAVR